MGGYSAIVGVGKGRNGFLWFIIGFVLGPIGLIWALLMPKAEGLLEEQALRAGTKKQCPFCAGAIKVAAIHCRFFSSDLGGHQLSQGPTSG